MVRELAISFYLFVFRTLFNTFKLFPQKKKTVGVASFGDNIFYVTRSIRDLSNEDIIILKDRSCNYRFDPSMGKIMSFDFKHPISYVKSIYHLATASTVLVDTYYGFLAVTDFRENTTCVQLWHAAGAIKKFGLEDPTNGTRSEKAMNRFKQVYSRFHYTTVGSDEMAATFQQSFGLTEDNMIRTGIPRTDILFNKAEKARIYEYIKQDFPAIENKKILLYAPTFRNEQLTDFQMQLDIAKLYHELSDEYVLFIKNHPAVSYRLDTEYKDFVYDVSNFQETNKLLLITDVLITDYSSLPFEFSLLEKPMIFFSYDMEEYKVTSGLINNYESQMPGPVVFSTEAIVQTIKQNAFDLNQVRSFAKKWNEYSSGDSSDHVARLLTGTETEEREEIPV
ncbi:CDP-glycerol glycerophosphotransferase family protein [Lentibacillus sediminis]|uniref:CDP-glycerol glycerophosphotransferase family protein n=1 Tax=Lentibacillus sediminis TaxID=1940529 RepID=UPI000C1BA2D4|nr:CDP-glycerol glycerophosphotransferase family protein [Lentibacillus sediminis]